MNIKKRQKLRPRRFNLYNLLVASMKKDVQKAIIECSKIQNKEIESAYQKLLINGAVIIDYNPEKGIKVVE